MSIPKKGSRKIICSNQCFRWRVSRDRILSDWKLDATKVDPVWLERAQKHRLGRVADIRITVAIEAFENPAGRILLHVLGTLIDGFLGYEHDVQVKPKMIGAVIEQALDEGWNPSSPQEFKIVMGHEPCEPFRPVMLLFGDGPHPAADYPQKVILFASASNLL